MTRLRSHQFPPGRLADALRSGGLDDLPDADLLDRFARYGEHPAFETLLRRHGAMVFGVCRRVLANLADAEDAFQATFLVLVRRARAVRRGDRLGPWLYGVAVRVAMKARARAAKLASRQSEATDMIPDPTSPGETPDWLPILDAELNALPAKYREVLVLCELRGASRAEAAKTLRIPEGTLSSRLARGRDLLRKRLLKHGTLLPAGGLALLFTMSGVGRATVPAMLLAKTSEVAAVVALGSAPVGAVPAGAARLTDEVLKAMFLTKLRTASGAILAATLVLVGLAAANSSEAPAQPDKPKTTAKAADTKPQPTKGTATGAKSPDREALQGLWVLEKLRLGVGIQDAAQGQEKEMIGRMRILVSGDTWWSMVSGPGGNVTPQAVKLDSTKNPKWIDFTDLDDDPTDVQRCIYELDGDKLRISIATDDSKIRPAEFDTLDGAALVVMEFRREKMPPAAGDKALIGSWASKFERVGVDFEGASVEKGKMIRTHNERVEILDGYLFVRVEQMSPQDHRPGWIGGKYTVDTTKNPKWIDLELVAPSDEKVTKLYGSYEVREGELLLVFGSSGKRVTRPLALENVRGVEFFELKPTREPLKPRERVKAEAAPAPKKKSKAPPGPKGLGWGDDMRHVMKTQGLDKAETMIRERMAENTGILRAICQYWLGCVLVERAKDATAADATKLVNEAADLFRKAIDVAKECQKEGGPYSKYHAPVLLAQAELRCLQVLQLQKKPDELLIAATAFLEHHRGSVEELIALSLMYHALKQKNESGRALQMRDRMKELFDKLKDEPDAFYDKTGEYSREYWEKTWFTP